MRVELVYYPINYKGFDPIIRKKWIEIPKETDIKDILPLIHGKGLAAWQDDSLGGKVVGNYRDSGKVKSNTHYFILSKNIPKTIKALDNLKDAI